MQAVWLPHHSLDGLNELTHTKQVAQRPAHSKCSINVSCAHHPEKAMAPHSSTLAWKIPWMEEPSGLQSMGLLRVRHN